MNLGAKVCAAWNWHLPARNSRIPRSAPGNQSACREVVRLSAKNNKGITQVFNDLSHPLAY